MNSEHAEEISQPQDAEPQGSQGERVRAPANGAATVIVRGETVTDQSSKPAATVSQPNAQKTPAPQRVSEVKLKLQNRLPLLDDVDDIGAQREQIVVRDGKPDLAFTGSLLASAAPSSASKGYWEELRVYQTSAGKHVFSKIKRTVFAEEHDEHQAEIFDPAPTSTTAQLLRSAHDLTHSKPKTWKDAAIDFFGYEPLAKELYRKLGEQFEEHVS